MNIFIFCEMKQPKASSFWVSPSNGQTKRRSGTETRLAPAPLQVFHFALQWSCSDFPNTHSASTSHYLHTQWIGTNNKKSHYCSTNHTRQPKLVFGGCADKDVSPCLFGLLLKEGRRGQIRISSSHSITKFNTVDEELQRCTITTQTSCLLSISKYKILCDPLK